LISSRSRSQRQIDMAVTPNSFCTVSTRVASVAVERLPF
jgi:hypothetical protein